MPDAAVDRDLSSHVAAALLPFRVGGLIDASRERILAAAALLPAGASRFFGLECRLADPEPTADFLACIAAASTQRETWAMWLAKSADRSEVERRLADFVEDWANPGSPYYGNVVNMWVEFDLASLDADGSTPNLFLGTDNLGAAQSESAGHGWLVDAVSQLTGMALSRRRRETLARCLVALPSGGRLFQTGIMLARPDPVLRLCLRKIEPAGLPGYLTEIGWPGPRREVESLLQTLAPMVDDISIDLDVGDAVKTKIGFECYLTEDDRLTDRVSAFVDYLRRTGLCTPTKAAGLLAWYGLTHERWCRERWPADLREDSGRPSPRHSGGFLRTLHHVKLNLDPAAAIEAKAYLGARFAWVDDVALKRILAGREAGGGPGQS